MIAMLAMIAISIGGKAYRARGARADGDGALVCEEHELVHLAEVLRNM